MRRSQKLSKFKTDLWGEKTKAQITRVINNRGDITTESTDIIEETSLQSLQISDKEGDITNNCIPMNSATWMK